MPNFRPACTEDYAAIRALLAAQGLPSEDVGASEEAHRFHLAEQDGQIVGCAGLEVYGTDALLRSVAVAPSMRDSGLGRALVDITERDAAAIGVQRLFLLTTSAADYFSRIGYKSCNRSVAPSPVQTSSQFSRLCPVSAVCMSKELLAAQ
ncbi:arsenic resistance N-acetyltransferase ArsN2 [Ralstonia solanacearum]|uniref:arsenic resistance N-acetyltransferase ArsN2 n=1 Tax=Ralstonia solanacearum TaxID=305 RepID=UPI000E6710B5|nr:arsenic resistance N-acetyltransferase ArsN2 [Ralstonia solanacearum]RIJ86350.1 GNAT family N-acetyltransferase [Ralstonia solanacearum]